MPNSRKEGKKNVSAWIDQDNKVALLKAAKARGIPLSNLLDELISEKLDQLKRKTKKIRKKNS